MSVGPVGLSHVWIGVSALAGAVCCAAPLASLGPAETHAEARVGIPSLTSAGNDSSVAFPWGRAIGALTRTECFALLDANRIDFEAVDAEGVEFGVRLQSPLNGVQIEHRGRSAIHSVIDCRLAAALLSWTSELRRAGVASLVHYSVYRPGARVRGSGVRSGHASALAIDVGMVRLVDGTALNVEEVWLDRRRGVAPCPAPATASGGPEPAEQALLRHLVCESVTRDLFQVVLTPHHDQAHHNHVHLEVRPGVDWTHVR